MRQGPAETNNDYLYRFNSRLKNLILLVGKNILCSLKNIDKVGETYTLEEVKNQEEKFNSILFLLQANESRYVQLFVDMSRAAFVRRYEYPETINGAY